MDRISIGQRHANMAAIHSLDTKPEMVVRKWLWNHGFRYRLNHCYLPGKPDIVMRKYKTCIFVNGCFWHGHKVAFNDEGIISSTCCRIPKTNTEFWVKKIARNQERDLEVKHKLNAMGWNCITVWECELKPAKREATLQSLAFTLNEIFLNNNRVKPYKEQEDQQMMAAESASKYGIKTQNKVYHQ